MRWTRIFGAVLRHLLKWASGKDLDEESGLPHLAHAAFGLLTLLEYSKTWPGLDDRPKNQAEIPQMSEVSPAQGVLLGRRELFESDIFCPQPEPEVLEAAQYPDTYKRSQFFGDPLFGEQEADPPEHTEAARGQVETAEDACRDFRTSSSIPTPATSTVTYIDPSVQISYTSGFHRALYPRGY